MARRGPQALKLLAVAMVDLDGFKAVNDTQGHLAKDEVLVEVAAALGSTLRDGDDLFRIGGDELAAVFDVFDERDAAAVGERLCAAARSTGRITVSVGIAVVPPGQPDLPGLLEIADEALYTVKRRGRDGVEATDLRVPRALPRPGSAA